jgi:phosphoribosylaminoimidazolecarboxamide formyltransferase/IMP cyclohydrolase
LRYGENPHQRAALYASAEADGANLVSARQLSGKELSYNNILDLDAALAIVRDLPDAGAVVIKHNNPCGAASATKLSEATRGALQGDPVSAFGSVLGFNRVVDSDTAQMLSEPGLFIEAIVAPDYESAALEILTTRPKWKANVRLVKVGQLDRPSNETHFRHISGGMLVQEADLVQNSEDQWHCPTQQRPADEQMPELRFAWALVRHVKSNAIVITRDLAACGVGAGQMSRVDAVDIAISKAGQRASGAVLASDAFFPFEDSIDKAAAAGIRAIIQPGGSKRDNEVVAACNKHGTPMILTGRRHFKH